VMAQAIGFATGGYLAGRLRSPALDGVIGERTFRDAAEGFHGVGNRGGRHDHHRRPRRFLCCGCHRAKR
jgi:hypothetical protein